MAIGEQFNCTKCGDKEFCTVAEVEIKGNFCGYLEVIAGQKWFMPRRVTTWETKHGEGFGELACCGCGAVIGADREEVREP